MITQGDQLKVWPRKWVSMVTTNKRTEFSLWEQTILFFSSVVFLWEVKIETMKKLGWKNIKPDINHTLIF